MTADIDDQIPQDPSEQNVQAGRPESASADGRSEQTDSAPPYDRSEQADVALPYGLPGKPLVKGPFLFGLVGGLGVLTAIGIANLLTTSVNVIIQVVVAMFLAVGLNPAVEALQRRNQARRWAITIVFVGVIVVFVLFGVAIVPPVSQETADFVSAVPGYVDQLMANPTLKQLDADYQILSRVTEFFTADLTGWLAGGLVGVSLVVLNSLFTSITLLVLTLYFLGSLHTIKEYLFKLVPSSRRTRTAAMTEQVLTGIGGYVAGNILISVIAGVLTWAFLSIAGMKYALALALMVALTDLIPLVGATIGAALVTLVALFQSLPLALACAVFFVIYQQVENYFIYPKVMKRSVNVAPAVTVVAALFGGALLGVIGALLAIPVAAAIALIIREVVIPRQAQN